MSELTREDVLSGLRQIAGERDTMATALAHVDPSKVFDFLDAVERDLGAEYARKLGAIRDRELQKEMDETTAS